MSCFDFTMSQKHLNDERESPSARAAILPFLRHPLTAISRA